MRYPEQTSKTESSNGSQEMNSKQARLATGASPLYASPWLAFFYLIFRAADQDES